MKILLLEDDAMLQEIICEHLEEIGHDVASCSDGFEAETLALEGQFDMWLLDINVPGQDGLELLKGLRQLNSSTPAIFITAQTGADVVRRAFDTGADDYLKKPFDIIELNARVGYVQKKLGLDQEILTLNEQTHFNLNDRTVTIGEKLFQLSPKESKLLHFLATHKMLVHSHETLNSFVWENETVPTDNTLRTYIKKLRQILGKDAILTVHGQGYKFEY